MVNCGYGCCGCPLAGEANVRRLSELTVGEEGIVIGIDGSDELRFRIMEMGLIIGTSVKVVQKAPMKDPIAVQVRGYDLSLRLDEANAIAIGACPSLKI